jgi:CheY-like chemotaxis protein
MHSLVAEDDAPRVLVIDDEREHTEIMAALLRREGYEVEVALDAADGVARAVADPPDLILLDLWMPTVDGLAAARLLREHPRTRAVPLIFLSASDPPGDLPDLFLAKPFHAVELLELASATVGRK